MKRINFCASELIRAFDDHPHESDYVFCEKHL